MKLKQSFKGSIVMMVSISVVVLAAYATCNKEVLLTVDGQTLKVDTMSNTVEEVLRSNKITLKRGSKLEPSLDTKIANSMEIKVVNQFKINIDDGGAQKEYETNQEFVWEVLESCNISLGEKDITSKALDEKVEKDEVIKITRVKEEEIIEKEEIPYTTKTIEEKTLLKGKQQTKTKGKNGEKEIIYKITYNNDKPISKEKISERIIINPITEVVQEGMLEAQSM